MKARTSFVSNSSSTSFTVFGVRMDDDNKAYELAQNTGLDVLYGDPNGWNRSIYVGLVLAGEFEHCQRSDLKDDETKNQFVERIKAELPEDLRDQADWYSESFRDD